jgi:hypothetical protein
MEGPARVTREPRPNPTTPGRFLEETQIIAFSDPNDLMSYPVPVV